MMTVKLGSKGEDVRKLQTLLGIKPCDGIFGAGTDKAVREFQRQKGLVADGIVGNKTWEALQAKTKSAYKKSKRTIKEIIVHCSATPEGKNFTVEDIRKWHKQQGWSDIGYHYVVYLDGSVHLGRDVDFAGAHCTGHNSYSIGVCYVGGCDARMNAKDTRTIQQKNGLVSLLKELKKIYPNASIHGHCDFANKACPSFDATSEYRNIH